MNSKKARALRKLIKYDNDKEASMIQADVKYIGIIDGVNGNHDVREEAILERRSNEERYLYRKLKQVYTNRTPDPEVKKQLVDDLRKLTGGNDEQSN